MFKVDRGHIIILYGYLLLILTKQMFMIRNMLLSALLTVGIFTAVVYTSCSKSTDACDNIVCQHGGSCVKGICYCPTGYSGTYCEKRNCEVNNTAIVTFSNKSASSTYAVLWDGSIITTLAPGETSESYTVSAGIQHTLLFRYSNSTTAACSQSTPTLAQCSSINYFCTY